MSCYPAAILSSGPYDPPYLFNAPPPGEFPFAAWLDREELACLGRFVAWRKLKAGELLWREGERGDCLALVVRGELTLLRNRSARRNLPPGTCGTGELAGDLSFADGRARETSARATDEAEVVLLSREAFDRLAPRHPALARRLLGEVLRGEVERIRGDMGDGLPEALNLNPETWSLKP